METCHSVVDSILYTVQNAVFSYQLSTYKAS